MIHDHGDRLAVWVGVCERLGVTLCEGVGVGVVPCDAVVLSVPDAVTLGDAVSLALSLGV